MGDKSKVGRVVITGDIVLGATPPNHEFGLVAPPGYRIISANGTPDEDGTYDVPVSILLQAVDGSVALNRAVFRVHIDAAMHYTCQIVCERSDEPDLITSGTVVTF